METDSRLVDRPEGIEQLAADEVDTQVASLRASCVFQEVLQALGHFVLIVKARWTNLSALGRGTGCAGTKQSIAIGCFLGHATRTTLDRAAAVAVGEASSAAGAVWVLARVDLGLHVTAPRVSVE